MHLILWSSSPCSLGVSSSTGQAESLCRAAWGSAPNVTVVLQLALGADEAVHSSGSRSPAEFYPPEICASAGQITEHKYSLIFLLGLFK